MHTHKTVTIYDFIIKYHAQHDKPPTIREIQLGCNLSSTSVVSEHLKRLQRTRHIERRRGQGRGIRILKHHYHAPHINAQPVLFAFIGNDGTIDILQHSVRNPLNPSRIPRLLAQSIP